MGKWAHDFMMDQSLAWVRTTSTKMTVCKSQPSTHLQAGTTYALAYTIMAVGDYTIADGTTSGRKVTVAQKANLLVNTSGTATHICLFSNAGTYVVYVTTCVIQYLTATNTVTVPAWAVEIRDPA